ncbi:MAG: hypothetical protein A4E23_00592 [Methanomethylovorans sp. PtaU1.Bin073]|nr:MAG: hypothetical protein A4E23_00592 [Methanomethylovorans sp. PtaU1.Bin073]
MKLLEKASLNSFAVRFMPLSRNTSSALGFRLLSAGVYTVTYCAYDFGETLNLPATSVLIVPSSFNEAYSLCGSIISKGTLRSSISSRSTPAVYDLPLPVFARMLQCFCTRLFTLRCTGMSVPSSMPMNISFPESPRELHISSLFAL